MLAPLRPDRRVVLVAAAVVVAFVANGLVAGAAPAPAPAFAAGQNVAVTNRQPAQRIEDFQSPSVAVNPKNPSNAVIASRFDSPDFMCQIQFTVDGGRTWSPSTFPAPSRGTCWAAAAAFDDTNHVYVTAQNRPTGGGFPQDIIVWASADGGKTFGPAVTVRDSAGVQPSVAVDTTRTKHPGGPAVYVSWYGFQARPQSTEVWLSYSEDGGATWSAPVSHAIPGEDQFFPTPAVGPDGNVYVVYKEVTDFGPAFGACPGIGAKEGNVPASCPIRVLRSTDGGRTLDSSGPNGAAGFQAAVARYNDLSTGEAPSLATAPNGDLLVSYASLPTQPLGAGCKNDLDVFVVRSADKGATWGTPARVNDDPCGSGATQRDPWVSVAPNGRVDVVFYDNRGDPDHVLTDAMVASSSDGGRTFGPSRRISDRSFDGTASDTERSSGFQSKEFDTNNGIASFDAGFIAAWGDARNTFANSPTGDRLSATSDVVAVPVAVNQPAAAKATTLWGTADPVATSVAASRATFSFADTVTIAPSAGALEAIAAAPLARKARGPVLLAEKDGLSQDVKDEISRLRPTAAFVVGGPGVLGSQIERDLAQLGITNPTRLGGNDAAETAAAVARTMAPAPGTAAMLVAEADPAVGAAASAVAASARMPVLFVQQGSIPAATRQALQDLRTPKTFVVGDDGVVAESVVKRLTSDGHAPTRIAGSDPHETAAKLAESAATSARFGVAMPRNVVYVASDGQAAGAAAVGAVVAYRGGVLLLGDNDGASEQYLRSHAGDVDQVVLIGDKARLRADATTPTASGGGGSSGWLIGLVAFAVVVVVGGAGLALSRRGRRSSAVRSPGEHEPASPGAGDAAARR